MQNSLFDLQNRYASLSKTGDPLVRLGAIDLEIFRPALKFSPLSSLIKRNLGKFSWAWRMQPCLDLGLKQV